MNLKCCLIENTFMKRINLLICLIGFSTMLHAQLSMDIETGFIKVNSNDAGSSWKNSLGDLNGLEGTLLLWDVLYCFWLFFGVMNSFFNHCFYFIRVTFSL